MAVIDRTLLKERFSNGKPVSEDSFRSLLDSVVLLEADQQAINSTVSANSITTSGGIDINSSYIETDGLTAGTIAASDIYCSALTQYAAQFNVATSGTSIRGNIVNLSAAAVTLAAPPSGCKKIVCFNRMSTSVDVSPPIDYRINSLATGAAYTMGTNTAVCFYAFSTARLVVTV